ncbi:peptidylprolyl isomerase [Pseudoduganella sp. OTU4001]|uniref:peptidylprolyl isomerase n=1 Tax=Pseudoduganella sp. OTU4001 TaxID=3043854 RepID=UPI00313D772E
MRVLDLSGHYQRPVQIDSCPQCCLVWFDDTESVRLAGPGIAGLVREIHGAMQAGGEHAHAVSLARVQHCPVCTATLKSSANMTRFGRTTHLECPNGHGYYQTYILYLAEKGFVRPLAWSDTRSMLAEGKEMFCAGCGSPLPARPLEACPACQSAIGIVDPSRLASAIERHSEAEPEPRPEAAPPSVQQHKCHACGGAIDVTRAIRCPHCHAPVLRTDTASAAAVAAVAATGERRKRYGRRLKGEWGYKRRSSQPKRFNMRLAIGLVFGLLVFGTLAWYRQSGPLTAWKPQEAGLMSYSQHFRPPAFDCDPNASVRRLALVRQMIVSPDTGTLGAARSAHVRAIALRKQWEVNGGFERLAEPDSNPFAPVQAMQAVEFRRGEAPPIVDQAAFCLRVNEISPPILAADGFHLIQVVDAR